MNDLPPPTDDELLMAFVDGCISTATADWRRRTNIWWEQALTSSVHEHFEREWKKRMGTK